LFYDVTDGVAPFIGLRIDHAGTGAALSVAAGNTVLGSATEPSDEGKLNVTAGSTTIASYVGNTGFDSKVMILGVEGTSDNSAYNFAEYWSGRRSDNTSGDIEFKFRGDGEAYADASWNASGADYAEYFEWSDGNSSSEDRIGLSVVLDGNKIREATGSDAAGTIIGVISGNATVVGDTAFDKWTDKYEKDDYGRYVMEDFTSTEWEETIKNEDDDTTSLVTKWYETDKIPSDETVPDDAVVVSQDDKGNNLRRKKLNSDYNDSLTYVEREDRKEWDTVGLMGKLRMKKGQQTGTNWIKMRDVSGSVEEWLVR